MKLSIIGSGLQANRRIQAAIQCGDEVISILSNNIQTASLLEKKFNIELVKDLKALQGDKSEAVIICTPPSSHIFYAIEALNSGKHVLIEKPLARNLSEVQELTNKVIDSKSTLQVACGFNHRFHPAIMKLREMVKHQQFGQVLFVRAIYGNSLRENYATEWRSDPNQAAGGQLAEQGSHLLDLIIWMFGKLSSISCQTTSHLIENAILEDTGLIQAKTKSGPVIQLVSSLALWHNRFEFEVYCTNAFLKVAGLGGSYGVETLEVGQRGSKPPFEKSIFEFRNPDDSWIREWDHFKLLCNGKESEIARLGDGISVMSVVDACYRSDSSGQTIQIYEN
jgi:predicted dehydrogenase